jgi:hypothetical protein
VFINVQVPQTTSDNSPAKLAYLHATPPNPHGHKISPDFVSQLVHLVLMLITILKNVWLYAHLPGYITVIHPPTCASLAAPPIPNIMLIIQLRLA